MHWTICIDCRNSEGHRRSPPITRVSRPCLSQPRLWSSLSRSRCQVPGQMPPSTPPYGGRYHPVPFSPIEMFAARDIDITLRYPALHASAAKARAPQTSATVPSGIFSRGGSPVWQSGQYLDVRHCAVAYSLEFMWSTEGSEWCDVNLMYIMSSESSAAQEELFAHQIWRVFFLSLGDCIT